MSLLNEKDRDKLIDRFDGLDQPVKLIVFSQDFECQYCRETRQIAEELAVLSPNISVANYDFVADHEVVEAYQVDKIPAIVVVQDDPEPRDFGIRYYGVPAGYEFSSLIEDLVIVSSDDSGLTKKTRAWAAGLTEPVHLQVFVTPTCPYSPQADILAHKLAMESDSITADMVEATEFPHLAMKYNVMGVPRTVVNETIHLEGAAPEQVLVARIEEAVAVDS
jgi:glutaredoxin-like protein